MRLVGGRWRAGAVGEDGFSAGVGEFESRAEVLEQGELFVVAGDEVKASGSGPAVGEVGVVEEDGRGVGEDGAEPEAVDAAVVDEELPAGVEGDGGGV